MVEPAETQRQEAQRLIDLLKLVSEARLRAASAPSEVAFPTRSAVRTRGARCTTPIRPVQQLHLAAAFQAIEEAHWDVRRQVALTLREWRDEIALQVLERLAKTDSEWRVREAVAEALSTIGGPQAVELLTFIVKTDPHPRPAERALTGLGDLALAAWPDELKPREAASTTVRTRGAVRVRGASPSRRISPEADALLALLDQVRFRHPDPSVRAAADDTLARLDE
jgi:HEAT repeat protein